MIKSNKFSDQMSDVTLVMMPAGPGDHRAGNDLGHGAPEGYQSAAGAATRPALCLSGSGHSLL